jgi:hypothetical protein
VRGRARSRGIGRGRRGSGWKPLWRVAGKKSRVAAEEIATKRYKRKRSGERLRAAVAG